ncbi:MAG: type ISP restriction/modification enzyme, partial [Acetobacteraceae bacterium]
AAGWSLHVPFIDSLFQRIATPEYLKPLRLEEPLAWAAAALNRVDRDGFFARFNEADAVRYFYEPFLAAFDPVLRKTLGVWYTPREIVRYMVGRVDQVLRTELGLADGLADPSVWVLDPCCGTGSYLVEVLDRIRRTLQVKGEDALSGEDLKLAATTRVAGFEIMPAPYVIAHWQVGHALRAAGVPLGAQDRAAIYLTNALTGWAPAPHAAPPDAAQRGLAFSFPPLAEERDEAAKVKQARPILVGLGNPPYNGFASTSPAEEQGLVEPYKEGLQSEWGIRKFNLDDLYVRFFRIAERRIAETTGRGIVCYITNHSWLWYPSYVVMRKRLLSEFGRLWIDNLNGSKFETGKTAPDGTADPSVFSTEASREGIQVGTAVALLAKKQTGAGPKVLYRDFWGSTKRADLLASVGVADLDAAYERASPLPDNRFSLRPTQASNSYQSWPALPEIAALPPFSGVLEKRRGALLSLDRARLVHRMRRYLDPEVSFEDLKAEGVGPVHDMARFKARGARARLLRAETFSENRLRRVTLCPFETRWAYHTNVRPIWNEPRPGLVARLFPGNAFLATRLRARRPGEGLPMFWTPLLPGDHLLDPNCHPLPVLAALGRANLSPAARAWLAALGLPDPDCDRDIAVLPWYHALAIGYAPAWRAENGEAIRQGWPRVPLPDNADRLRTSAALGARIALLLDPDTAVPGVTSGTIEPALAGIAVPSKRGNGAMTEGDRALTAGWGHAGKGGAVMPGHGRIVSRAYAAEEAAAKAEATLLGGRTRDVFLNADAYWRNIPDAVWSFAIGGYQVLKKWLSYREKPLLGRALTPGEVRYFRDVARRLAALCLLAPALDANYRACAAANYTLPVPAPDAAPTPPGTRDDPGSPHAIRSRRASRGRPRS